MSTPSPRLDLQKPIAFVSYAREDETAVRNLVARLRSAGFETWLDVERLLPGDHWEHEIRKAIPLCPFFLLVLSRYAMVDGRYLAKELARALKIQERFGRGSRYIIPVRLEEVSVPARVAHLQPADLFRSDGFDLLTRALTGTRSGDGVRNGTRTPAWESDTFPSGGLRLPVFFPSVSSAAKVTLTAVQQLEILSAVGSAGLLVSAYDVQNLSAGDRRAFVERLKRLIENGSVVLMDSGVYEQHWLKAYRWTKTDFYKALRSAPYHLAFCFDDPRPPSVSPSALADKVIADLERQHRRTALSNLIPVIHARRPSDFPSICSRIVRRLHPELIALPERELGDGVLTGVRTVRAVRSAMLDVGVDSKIHLLGTGNPISILLYSAAGVSSFDGLDWSQTVVDYDTGALHHSRHLELFAHQSPFAGDSKMPFYVRLMGHNLGFMHTWMEKIQEARQRDAWKALVDRYLPPPILGDATGALWDA